jgi:hypothetical protein
MPTGEGLDAFDPATGHITFHVPLLPVLTGYRMPPTIDGAIFRLPTASDRARDDQANRIMR